ncbi:ribosomal L7Ae/L30e/S12e/Gadd45 family protein [Clostridium saccharobutylicum]|uniref:Ribosomal protein L7Ae/L30e/S12e/gadd45 n=1 Tax=Clostridium saccharobutylicum DSM 13864 TaxID=1345695 RepID=U5MPF0_CLOSA|nr:ribosomal L7Ae/L30e/S12e/Gadd45 family protein [Clostridium saccharobutylicum]AGX42440.1 ribosomal protein L7Ae/L30e/S12e/gadd45 [Clostridium saccharobutylicum DSM 13864]AQR89724.1 ribosomal protein L7Ae family protein [Clostridium saccharobutylicum]AQR99626.1 ribosomal protein L7Ae family protein [Clostridium saccharobutylicum]AQS09356.1 ribosomal protein L7Ae family protein [Clostridium saccharobutylicum]AQS13612.1 ribosomal protein L7Ae family protein [Clostridium saccharobutylicum]
MNRFFNFLSIAKKSGNLLEGYSKCDDYRNNTKIYLFIISNDLSDKSKSKFKKHCNEKDIPYIEDFSKDQLGAPLGRKEVMLLGILDNDIAKKMLALYEEEKIYE